MTEPIDFKQDVIITAKDWPAEFLALNTHYPGIKFNIDSIYITYIETIKRHIIGIDQHTAMDARALFGNYSYLCRVLLSILDKRHPVYIELKDHIDKEDMSRNDCYLDWFKGQLSYKARDIKEQEETLCNLKKEYKIYAFIMRMFTRYVVIDYVNAFNILKLVDSITATNLDSVIKFIDKGFYMPIKADEAYSLLKYEFVDKFRSN